MFSRCGTICSIQIPTIPLSNIESPCKLIFTPERSSSHLEEICSIEIEIVFTVLQHTPYVKQGSATNLESSTNSTGTLLRLFAFWELNRFYLPLNKESSLPASRSSSLLIREDHVLNRGHSSSLRWMTTCLT